jgi:hypothetical protein
MNTQLVSKLILFLVDQLQEKNAPISTIRLVKYLYLIDIEYFSKFKQTLTSIHWIRYHFGPYFFAWPDITRSLSIDLEPIEKTTESKRIVTYRVYDEQDISQVVSYPVESSINRIIDEWCYEDLDVLLAHVYSTAPMKSASFLQPLDFTTLQIAKPQPVRKITPSGLRVKLSAAQSDVIKKQLSAMRSHKVMDKLIDSYDEFYFDAIQIMDLEDKSLDAIEGSIQITQSAFESINNQFE